MTSGSYEANSMLVTIESTTAGAEIYYTTDETDPSSSSTRVHYTGSFSIEASRVIKAVAEKSGMMTSEVASAWYDLYWWQALGSGMNGSVYALAVDSSGNLYAGGSFTTAGGVSANRIAKWNGSSWS
ncbi:MAG: chitobiase/beta-hexosaminidase C-terminal domain-containing protein, partial [Candidatus Margulisiibacteriota bacterium]